MFQTTNQTNTSSTTTATQLFQKPTIEAGGAFGTMEMHNHRIPITITLLPVELPIPQGEFVRSPAMPLAMDQLPRI